MAKRIASGPDTGPLKDLFGNLVAPLSEEASASEEPTDQSAPSGVWRIGLESVSVLDENADGGDLDEATKSDAVEIPTTFASSLWGDIFDPDPGTDPDPVPDDDGSDDTPTDGGGLWGDIFDPDPGTDPDPDPDPGTDPDPDDDGSGDTPTGGGGGLGWGPGGNPDGGQGNGDGSGDGDGDPDKPDPAPTPPDVPFLDSDTVQFSSSYTFSVDDITVGFDGSTLADRPENLDQTTTITTKEGITINPIDSEFGFYVHDFIGAQQKEWDGDFGEGFVGELPNGDGIAVADARTDTFSTPARLGTWLEGIGGNFVKASTEHYSTMQAILSDQAFPGDDSGFYQLDDDLRIIDYQIDDSFMPILDGDGKLQEDVLHDFYVKELVSALEQAESATPIEIDFDRDGTADTYTAYMSDQDFEGTIRNVAVVDIGNDGTIDVVDGNLNGFGNFGIADVLAPNESTILADIAVGDDYSVTLKDDGKLLYRWGNAVKRPNDVRIDTKLDLPEEWNTVGSDGLKPLYRVTAAELVVNHTVTNNPNDQIRPEDFENEAAIGTLPEYIEVQDPFDASNVLWVSVKDVYAGDGTFLPSYITQTATSTVVLDLTGNPVGYLNVDENGDPIGTVLRDFSLIELAEGSLLSEIGALSSDLVNGFTKAWYTTMDREPFQADLNDDGTAYEIGPRWRLQPDKYGQDLPSVTIPQDVSDPPPVQNGEEKYEVGADTTTVLNLLDWNGTSPLTLSAGWMINSGEVSSNGVNMTDAFDVAYYVKGDIKPVNLYDAELLLEYEEVTINDAGATIVGTIDGDTLAGKGSNTFDLSGAALSESDGQADLVVLGYGATTASEIGANDVFDFCVGEDALGLIGFDLNPDNYNIHITQELSGDDLVVSLDDLEIATLYDVTEYLEANDFYFA